MGSVRSATSSDGSLLTRSVRDGPTRHKNRLLASWEGVEMYEAPPVTTRLSFRPSTTQQKRPYPADVLRCVSVQVARADSLRETSAATLLSACARTLCTMGAMGTRTLKA